MNEQAAMVIRLALVDEQTLFREGLRSLMDHEPDFSVVGQAASVQALVALEIEPNVVVTDLTSPAAGFDIVIEQLRSRFDGVAIVALTALDDLQTIRNVLAAGADGYVLKSAGVTDLFAGIRAVARGGLYLQSSIGIAFASKPSEELVPPSIGGLTPKETDVLRLLALGHTNAEIAQLVGASLRTIETHRAHIHQKLDRHTRAELVRYSLDAGLLRLDERADHAPVAAVVVGPEPDSLDR
jgi:two-component system, NarL family, response regulator NreC